MMAPEPAPISLETSPISLARASRSLSSQPAFFWPGGQRAISAWNCWASSR